MRKQLMTLAVPAVSHSIYGGLPASGGRYDQVKFNSGGLGWRQGVPFPMPAATSESPIMGPSRLWTSRAGPAPNTDFDFFVLQVPQSAVWPCL